MNILLKYTDNHYGKTSLSVVKPYKGTLIQVIPPFNEVDKDSVESWYRKDLSLMPTLNVKHKSDLTV